MDELVKRLREVADEVDNDYDVDPYNAERRCLTILQAADAIEELSRAKDECDSCGNKTRSVIESLQEKIPRWIPVTERLPKFGERVLVFGGVTMYVAYYDKNRYRGESWHKLNSNSHYCNPTHWMPLPDPPTAEEGE